MYYVYFLQSEANPTKFYVGLTTDLERRLKDHNSGISVHTNKYKPWRLLSYTVFFGKKKARSFEGYLKTASGRAFAKKRL